MTTVTTTPNISLAQNVERSVYTALASGAALLIADGAAKGWTGISVPDWKAALTAVAAGLLTGAKNVVTNYLSTHQSLKAQVAALTAQVNAKTEVPAAPPAV
jgi:hypothetical protein